MCLQFLGFYDSVESQLQNEGSSDLQRSVVSQDVVDAQPRQQRLPFYPLGTREDVEQDDYQSPISTMYQNAWERYRRVEEDRRFAAREYGVPESSIRTMSSVPRTESADIRYIPVGGLVYPGTSIQLGFPSNASSTPMEEYDAIQNLHIEHSEQYTQERRLTHLRRQEQERQQQTTQESEDSDGFVVGRSDDDDNPIDHQIQRPKPLKDPDLTVDFGCKICMDQKIDTLIEPCMHLIMCRWCSEIWQEHARAARRADPSVRNPWKCPKCRKGITGVRRVYL